MRFIYTVLFYLLLPLVLLRLLWRARRAPAYAHRWRERFGWIAPRATRRPAIWVHAVSVGETLAAVPLLRQLLQHYPSHDLVVTTTTPTGSERVRAVFGEQVLHVYGPYDLPSCVGRFLTRVRPRLAIIMETELWPNTLLACRARGIPVLVANARLSERSARGYARVAGMTRAMLGAVSCIAAQTEADAARFVALGAAPERLAVTGNIKFDLSIDAAQRERARIWHERWRAGGQRPVLLAASTHPGEDELLLEALALLLVQIPDLLLVLVPRHPERFAPVRQLAERRFNVQLHSAAEPVAATTAVLVGDTMGEMAALLGASDLVFMGGTWVERGGHNLIEPAAWGRPQLCGPSLFNFAEVSRLLLEAGGLRVVQNPADLAQAAVELLRNPEAAERMGAAGRRIADANRGALQRLQVQVAALL